MGLPSPVSLSLSEAVALVMERCDCSKDDAKNALRRAGQDGRLVAIGSIPLSTHPNPEVHARHPVLRREPVSPADWYGDINWDASKISRYSSVAITKASLEAWLDIGRDLQSTSGFRQAPDPKIKQAMTAEYDRAETTNQKAPNVREISKLVQNRLRAEGFDASENHIQELASAEEFKKRRRKRGATIKSEKSRQER
jgi:hypothetical protein